MKGRIYAPAKAMTLLDIYPVGCVYISVNATSPETLFGGRWEQIKDVFLLASGNRYAAGVAGGEETHTLSEPEMPWHNHPASAKGVNGGVHAGSEQGRYPIDIDQDKTPNWDVTDMFTGGCGGSLPHNNMPPYLTVYIWKRTA